MKGVVIDENVPLVASRKHAPATDECIAACIDALERAREQLVLVDDQYLIFEKYQRHFSFRGEPGVGDVFFRWLWDNQANPARCQQVAVTAIPGDAPDFEEFPRDPSLRSFDPNDRVFAAVAKASPIRNSVLNASDTDWWHHREAFLRNGVDVKFLCPELMTERRRKSRI